MSSQKIIGFRSVRADGSDQIVTCKKNTETGEETTEVPLGQVQDIYVAEDHYIVYLDPHDSLWYARDPFTEKPGKEFNAIWSRVQRVKALPFQNAGNVKQSVYASLANGIGCALEGDFETANKSIDQAKFILIDESERQAKSWYVPVTAISGLVCSIIGFLFYVNYLEEQKLRVDQFIQIVCVSVSGGSIGALLSALAAPRSNSSFDPFAKPITGCTDGMLRILYGIVSAFIIILAVKAKIITSTIIEDELTHFSLLLVAVAGGFLERWAVDIIRHVRPQKSSPTPLANDT